MRRPARRCAGATTGPADVASRDADGYITFVGRADDVFKASDYRISPFELESALIEHPSVAEVAIVPSPDPVRLAVPKAYLILVAGAVAGPALAKDIFGFARQQLALTSACAASNSSRSCPRPSLGRYAGSSCGAQEVERRSAGIRVPGEYFEDDFDVRETAERG